MQSVLEGRTAMKLWSAESQRHRQRLHGTEHKGHTPSPRREIKIPDTSGIEPGPPGWNIETLPTTAVGQHLHR